MSAASLPRSESRSNIVTAIAVRDHRLCDCPATVPPTTRPASQQLRPPNRSHDPEFRSQTFLPLPLPASSANQTLLRSREKIVTGGRGRIRTSVARKERQIYSLLVLATHPPVRNLPLPVARAIHYRFGARYWAVNFTVANPLNSSENTKRTRVKRHQPVHFPFQDSLRLVPAKLSGGAGGGN
jgi:hypothetical protein